MQCSGILVDSLHSNFQLVGPPKPVKPSFLVARRIKNDAKFFIKDGSGTVTPTLNVFRESRPSGISVDVFWEPGSTNLKTKNAAVSEAIKTCQSEMFEVLAWSAFTVGNLHKYTAECVQAVVHTPTHTNKQHADLLTQSYLQINDEDDANRTKKATAVAKLLLDFAINHGEVVFASP